MYVMIWPKWGVYGKILRDIIARYSTVKYSTVPGYVCEGYDRLG